MRFAVLTRYEFAAITFLNLQSEKRQPMSGGVFKRIFISQCAYCSFLL